MACIRVTPEEIMRFSTESRKAANSIIKNVSSIESLMAQLTSAWQAEVLTAYMQKIESEMQHSKKLAEILLALSNDLMNVSQNFQASESNLTSLIADIIK